MTYGPSKPKNPRRSPIQSSGSKQDVKGRVTKCALYTRVSTDLQMMTDQGSLEAQEDRLRNFVQARNSEDSRWEIVDIYREEGCSGKDIDRPQLKRLLDDIALEKVNAVLVTKLDRFTRSIRDFHNVLDVLQEHGCAFVSISESFDTSTPSGKMVLNLLLIFAEFERETIGARTKEKMRWMAEQGHWPGGWTPLGYDATEDGLVENEGDAKVTRLMFEKYLELGSVAQVVKYMNSHGYRMKEFDSRRGKSQGGGMFYIATVKRMLQDATYVGKIDYEGDRFDGRHKAIVDEALWRRVQEALQTHARRHTNFRKKTKHVFLLLGRVRCGLCGAEMTSSYSSHPQKKKQYFYYRCTKETHHGKTACNMKQISAVELEEIVLEKLGGLSADDSIVRKVIDSINLGDDDQAMGLRKDRERASQSLKTLQKQINNIIDNLAKGFGGSREVQERLRLLEAQKRELERESDDLDFKIKRLERERLDAEVLLDTLKTFSYLITQATPEELQALIAMLVDTVVVTPEGIQLNLIERLDVVLKEKVSANVNPEGHFALTDIVWLPRRNPLHNLSRNT